MEEDADGDPRGDSGPLTTDDSDAKPPAWAKPAKRGDDIGRLAGRLYGKSGTVPDFTAAPPLVEAVRERYGDHAADALAGKVMMLLNRLNARVCHALGRNDGGNHSHFVHELRSSLRSVVAPYLYDLTSACGILARAVELAMKPAAPLESRKTELELVYAPFSPGYGPGDRVNLPDGRSGTIVTPRDATGRCGVAVSEDGRGVPGEQIAEMPATDDLGD